MTQSELADRVLEHMGVKAANQDAAGNDSVRAQEAVLSAWYRLRKVGMIPFAITAIPEWAQIPLRNVVAGDMASTFGLSGERLQVVLSAAQAGERELSRQVAGKARTKVRAKYF